MKRRNQAVCPYRFLCEGNKKTETVRKPDGMCHRQTSLFTARG
ncbi:MULTISPECIES: hypothetical protein [Bacteroides]|nr:MULTISPECIES: hypothetical protein [Bacteroides]